MSDFFGEDHMYENVKYLFLFARELDKCDFAQLFYSIASTNSRFTVTYAKPEPKDHSFAPNLYRII